MDGQGALVFDDEGMDQRDDRQRMWGVRRQVLGVVLTVWRADQGLSVQDAADRADMAPMTWRRIEQGLAVRRRTLAALDGVLGYPLGTVQRALADDYLMVQLAGRTGVVAPSDLDDDPTVVLDRLAARASGAHHHAVHVAGIASAGQVGTPAVSVGFPPPMPGTPWPVIDDQTRRALVALSHHVPTVRPTALDAVQQMVAQLAPLTSASSAIADAVRAAVAALPDLIARTVVEAGSECDLADVEDAEREAVSA